MWLVEKRSVTFERAVVLVLRPARAGSIERFPTVIPTRPAEPDSQSSTEASVSADMSPLTLASACHASVSAVTLASHHGITPSSRISQSVRRVDVRELLRTLFRLFRLLACPEPTSR